MDARTLEALKASIAKWERNAVAETPSDAAIYADSCPLCKLFGYPNPYDDDAECVGCPVMLKTGQQECDGSPYAAAGHKYRDWLRGTVDAEDFHAAASAEVAFLKSLLPSDEAAK